MRNYMKVKDKFMLAKCNKKLLLLLRQHKKEPIDTVINKFLEYNDNTEIFNKCLNILKEEKYDEEQNKDN